MNLKEQQNFINTYTGRLLGAVRLFGGYSPISPLAVFMFLTYRCNLSCPFCFQSRDRRSTFPDMSIDDAGKIEENIRRSFRRKPRVHLFGGEPTVNPDFLEILQLFSRNRYRISMTTNAVGLDRLAGSISETVNRIEINMSLNTEDHSEQFRALDSFKSASRQNQVYINIACPINRDNQGNLLGIVREFENSEAHCVTLQHSIYREGSRHGIDPGMLKEQVAEIKNSRFRKPVLFFPDIRTEDIEDYYGNPEFPRGRNKCVFPWFVQFIQPNGNVIVCEEIENVVGNAGKDSLCRLWNSKPLRQFRKDIQKNGISHPACYRCCHRQYY